MINNSIRQSIYEIDAFLGGYTLGTLIIENEQAFLELENNKSITLDKSFTIEVLASETYHFITFEQAVYTISYDGWSAYAGLITRVR